MEDPLTEGGNDKQAPRQATQPIVVLLIDDQPILGRAVKDMLQPESDVEFHFCQEPQIALELVKKVRPTAILQDLCMPRMDGLKLLKCLRSDVAAVDVPIIVLSNREDPLIKAMAFEGGASDYLVKLPNRIELIARLRHHSHIYMAQLQKNRAHRMLAESERQLSSEIAEAARYFESLLPPPLKEGRVRIDWRFVPSAQLGGDAFGYSWLNDYQLALYLLDVSGHGVGASLLAMSVLNILSNQTLPETDFHDPSAVMRGLNHVFSMDRHGERFFTIWYGIFDARKRTLTFSGGGHPPALLFGGQDATLANLRLLQTSGPPIGVTNEIAFHNAMVELPLSAQLLLYSDGIVEVQAGSGEVADQRDFIDFASTTGRHDLLNRLLERGRRIRGRTAFDDDCSLLLIEFT